MRLRGWAAPAAFALTVLAQPAAAQAFDARTYLDEAIAVVRAKALYADRVDWDRVSAEVHAEGDGAADVFGTYPALVRLVRALGDHHSFLQLSDERATAYRAARGGDFAYPPAPGGSRTADRSYYGRNDPLASDRVVRGQRIRTVIVPPFMGDRGATAAYAGVLHRQLAGGPRPCGYIVDLRGNSGGNQWPMLAGLSMLLGDGVLGGYTGHEGDENWFTDQGKAGIVTADGKRHVLVVVAGWVATPGAASAPVALLIDGGTASSGEIVGVAFSGRAQTRRFGRATFGVSTATQGYRLSDGANLVLVTDVTRDRTGKVFAEGLDPDVAVKAGPGDPDRAAAEGWVAGQCRSR
ncbi:S41 family peptidase [Sphingomonas sp. AOB5]|uniref:S41 family peptidase n=1 Tax=Sphingomonas sp. AOB5 TaxID=3034017 RepID=UPI0023F647A0|nr:S41 family peptidase [Sphingomonas sp. AOB5]MDF7777676.1 S41 family peptidase [Sphingomonas sp. AOB5]